MTQKWLILWGLLLWQLFQQGTTFLTRNNVYVNGNFGASLERRHSCMQLFGEKVLETTVSAIDNKVRLDAYLSTVYKNYSRSFFSGLCTKGMISVNSKVQDKSYKVHTGEQIRVSIIENELKSSIEPENIPLDIIFEDEHILAINKPNGMVVHPAVGSPNGTFVNGLLYYLGEKAQELLAAEQFPLYDNQGDLEDDEHEGDDLSETRETGNTSPGFFRPGIVHRLDKGTTGVLLAAKHPSAVEKLSKIFSSRKIGKTYLAVCVGHPGDTTICEPIGRSKVNRQIMCVTDGISGRDAITHTKTIAFDGKISIVLVRIETGRTHQIRVHLKERHTPILGDEIYGNRDWNRQYNRLFQLSRPLLHAYETEFKHPFTEQTLKIVAPLPPDLSNIVSMVSKKQFASLYSEPFYDAKERLLLCDTKVQGRMLRSKQAGGTTVQSTRLYVPLDRLKFEEENPDGLLEKLLE